MSDNSAISITNTDMAKLVETAIQKSFPNSFIKVETKGPLGSTDVWVRFALGKDKSEWENGIIQNDPLHMIFRIEGWDDDKSGQNGAHLDPKSLKARLIQGWFDGVKFPSNKMSAETLAKKLELYFAELKKMHESKAVSGFGDLYPDDKPKEDPSKPSQKVKDAAKQVREILEKEVPGFDFTIYWSPLSKNVLSVGTGDHRDMKPDQLKLVQKAEKFMREKSGKFFVPQFFVEYCIRSGGNVVVVGAGPEDIIIPKKKSLEVPRRNMPQIKKKHMDKFVNWLEKDGISVKETEIPVMNLKPTQKDFNTQKVHLMMNEDKHKLSKPLLVSSDNYILDGHHKWLAQLNIDEKSKAKCIQVGLKAKDFLEKAKQFSKVKYKDINDNMYEDTDPNLSYADCMDFSVSHAAVATKGDDLEKFYYDNQEDLDQQWSDFCFEGGQFEFGDAKTHFNNDKYFWDFVEEKMEKATAVTTDEDLEDEEDMYCEGCQNFFYSSFQDNEAYCPKCGGTEISPVDESAADHINNDSGNNNTGYFDTKTGQHIVINSESNILGINIDASSVDPSAKTITYNIEGQEYVVYFTGATPSELDVKTYMAMEEGFLQEYDFRAAATAKLIQKHNKNTDRKEWALVSKSDNSKVLEWFGVQKPSEEKVKKSEQRVQYFKHAKASQAPVVHNEILLKGKEPSFANPGWRAGTYTLKVLELPTRDNVAGKDDTVKYKAEIIHDPGYPDHSGIRDVLNKGRIDTPYVDFETKEQAVKEAKEAFKKLNMSEASNQGFVIETEKGKYLQSYSGNKRIKILTTEDKEKAMKFPLKQNAENEMARISLKGTVVEAHMAKAENVYFTKEIEHPTNKDLTVEFKAVEDDIDPADNLEIQEDIDRIKQRLNDGDGSAWFTAVVTVFDEDGVKGTDNLGGCDYNSFEEFMDEKKNLYWGDMINQATKDYEDKKASTSASVNNMLFTVKVSGDEVMEEFNLSSGELAKGLFKSRLVETLEKSFGDVSLEKAIKEGDHITMPWHATKDGVEIKGKAEIFPPKVLDETLKAVSDVSESAKYGDVKGQEPAKKDLDRMKDLKIKANGDEAKMLKLAQNMANTLGVSPDSVDKAIRRAKAAEKVYPGALGKKISKIFMDVITAPVEEENDDKAAAVRMESLASAPQWHYDDQNWVWYYGTEEQYNAALNDDSGSPCQLPTISDGSGYAPGADYPTHSQQDMEVSDEDIDGSIDGGDMDREEAEEEAKLETLKATMEEYYKHDAYSEGGEEDEDEAESAMAGKVKELATELTDKFLKEVDEKNLSESEIADLAMKYEKENGLEGLADMLVESLGEDESEASFDYKKAIAKFLPGVKFVSVSAANDWKLPSKERAAKYEALTQKEKVKIENDHSDHKHAGNKAHPLCPRCPTLKPKKAQGQYMAISVFPKEYAALKEKGITKTPLTPNLKKLADLTNDLFRAKEDADPQYYKETTYDLPKGISKKCGVYLLSYNLHNYGGYDTEYSGAFVNRVLKFAKANGCNKITDEFDEACLWLLAPGASVAKCIQLIEQEIAKVKEKIEKID
jgi:hypothetical protein